MHQLGDVEFVYLVGSLSKGIDVQVIDLLIFGHVDKEYLVRLIDRVEAHLSRKIRYLVYEPEEIEEVLQQYPDCLLLWSKIDNDEG